MADDTMSPKILIFENQFYQFEIYRPFLASSYEVYPDINSFKALADAARIFLNFRFPPEKRDAAKYRILDTITDVAPDAFIVDYVLVGNHEGKSGAHLALELLKNYKKPILFLSRTDRNTDEIDDALKKLDDAGVPWVWKTKGFAGSPILQPQYFEEHVIDDGLDPLLRRAQRSKESQELDGMIKWIVDNTVWSGNLKSTAINVFDQIQNRTPTDDEFRLIGDFRQKRNPDASVIARFVTDLISLSSIT